MTVGTSIFLSVVLLSIILLFISTKDRWKWKKIILFSVGGFIVLCLLVGGSYWIYITISDRPHYQDTFWDIPISASKSDVKFLKGEPSSKGTDSVGEWWEYNAKDYAYKVEFKGDKIHVIYYYAGEDSSNLHPCVQGIRYSDNYTEVVQKFGTPSDISISKDDLARVLSFKRYGVFFLLIQNKVLAYGIYNPTLGPRKVGEKKEEQKKGAK